MARVFQILVLLAAPIYFAHAECDATAYSSSATECSTAASKCSAGTDVCKMMDCSMEAATCAAKALGDAGCCDTAGMKEAFAQAQKAFDEAKKNDAYKDCDIGDYPACGGATSTKVSAFVLFAVLLSKMM